VPARPVIGPTLGVTTMNDEPPISHAELRDLFEHLDRTAMTGHECDHSFSLTRDFLTKRSLPVEPMLKWLGENGAGCDCEVMFNTAAQWEEIVGYVPPDEDA
jgi:hypothetical protein